MTTGLLGEAVDHRQPEAGALTHFLGREEGLERRGSALRRLIPQPVSPHRDPNVAAAAMHRAFASPPRYRAQQCRWILDRQLPRRRGIASRALIARFRIAFSSWFGSTSASPQIGRHRGLDLDRLAERAAEQLVHAAHELVDVDGFGVERLPARECEQALRQRRRSLARRQAPCRRSLRLGLLGRLPRCSRSRLPTMTAADC